MVDPVFKAPPPPPPVNSAETPNTTQVQEPTPQPTQDNVGAAPVGEQKAISQKQQIIDRLNELKNAMIRYFWYSTAGLFLLGAFFGCAMKGSDSAPKQAPVVSGISALVTPNLGKKGRMPICGSVLPSQGCLFYVLNNTGYDKVAEDYFDYVSNATQRSSFNIRRDNPTYAKTPIKPGHFAEIIVPAA